MIEKLCYLEDNVLKQPGLYTLWTILYLLNFVCLLSDETTGAVRNFNVLSNGLSVLYVGGTAVNNIYGNHRWISYTDIHIKDCFGTNHHFHCDKNMKN